ncbi:hypothetical protein HAX54_042173, partial [Datura stramonium]|nr:hypothetical protein [Datura stramonium]
PKPPIPLRFLSHTYLQTSFHIVPHPLLPFLKPSHYRPLLFFSLNFNDAPSLTYAPPYPLIPETCNTLPNPIPSTPSPHRASLPSHLTVIHRLPLLVPSIQIQNRISEIHPQLVFLVRCSESAME